MMAEHNPSVRRRGSTCLLSSTLLAMIIGGCATQSASVKSPAVIRNTPPAGATWIQMTPLTYIWTGFNDPNEGYSNLYTRILINSRGTRGRGGDSGATDAQTLPPYDYHDRGVLRRALWGKHYSINLTAYVTVGTYQATVPLVTIDHVSNRTDGERFQRVVAHTVQNFPLMLIKGDGSNAIATVRVVVKASDQTQSSVAAAAIQAAEGVAKAVSPESAVVTTLSAQSSKDKANALDAAINTLMSKQLDEEQLIDNDVRRWAEGARVEFHIPPPDNETTWNDSSNFATVGIWNITFEDPRPSIFADVQLCHTPATNEPLAVPAVPAVPAAPANPKAGLGYCRSSVAEAADQAQKDAAARAEQVLAYNLVNGTQSLGSVNSYLKQQAWWETSMKTFNGLAKGTAPKADDVSSFCRSIKDTVASIGLNAVDGGIIVAAVRDRAQLASEIVAAMKTTDECKYATTT
jgi:hypothetical protein